MGRINFENSFFEDEIRTDFYVPSIVKRAWACELELLFELDRVCNKYDINYSVDWGTLLGAVRHGGFIPWDDDIDVMMLREDLNKLMAVPKDEWSTGIEFWDYMNSDNNWKFVVSMVNTPRINFSEEYLKTHHNFPYIATIDIFPLDEVTEDVEFEKARRDRIKFLMTASDLLDEGITEERQSALFEMIWQREGLRIPSNITVNEQKRLIFACADNILQINNGQNTGKVAEFIEWYKDVGKTMPRSWFDIYCTLGFETLQVKAMSGYHDLLNFRYKNWHEYVYSTVYHNYPYFEFQRKSLGIDMDYVPSYSPEEFKKHKHKDNSGSIKVLARSFMDKSERFTEKLTNGTDLSLEDFADFQNEVIRFGESVERLYTDEKGLIAELEEICEEIYQLSCNKKDVTRLRTLLQNADRLCHERILKIREIVFVAYKPCYWNVFSNYYQKCIENGKAYDELNGTETRIIVIPTKVYHKDHLRRLISETKASADDYPVELTLVESKDYDFKLQHPEIVVIQNPYDEFNMETSVEPCLYASNIYRFTDKLVYIPYFNLKAFDKNIYAKWYNMKYYVLMPGVLLADEIAGVDEDMLLLYNDKIEGWKLPQ